MNERIKELAEQVGFRPYYDTGTGEVDADGQAVTLPNWSASDPWVSKCQKFAELLLKDVVDIVQPDPYDGDAMTASLNAKVKQIKQHFGVE